MTGVRATITRWVSSDQPGWIEVLLTDAIGRKWLFVEKVPVITAEALDDASAFPRPCVVDCSIEQRRLGPTGRAVVTINTGNPSGVESVEGNTVFEVYEDALVVG